MKESKVLIVIPARLESKRLSQKLLRKIDGESIIKITCKKLESLTAISEEIIVATDSDLIEEEISDLNFIKCYQSQIGHKNGTERCGEVAAIYSDCDIVVNVQADEVEVNPMLIENMIRLMKSDEQIDIATICGPLEITDIGTSSVVKAVVDHNCFAMDFVREVEIMDHTHLYHHIGVYAYKSAILLDIIKLPQSKKELQRSLEQLRWLEYGYKIKIVHTPNTTMSINTLEDLERYVANEAKYDPK